MKVWKTFLDIEDFQKKLLQSELEIYAKIRSFELKQQQVVFGFNNCFLKHPSKLVQTGASFWCELCKGIVSYLRNDTALDIKSIFV